ncbi:hypothetical protein BDR22DRAFT_885414 [Usnea florida]
MASKLLPYDVKVLSSFCANKNVVVLPTYKPVSMDDEYYKNLFSGGKAVTDREGVTVPQPSQFFLRKEELGHGTFGRVFKVQRLPDGKIFAANFLRTGSKILEFRLASVLAVIASSRFETTVQDEAFHSTLELFQRKPRVRSIESAVCIKEEPFDQNTIDRTVALRNPSPPRHQGVAGAREYLAALVIPKKIQETEPALHDLQELVTSTTVLPPDHDQMSSQFRKQDLGRRGEFGTTKPLTLLLHHSRGILNGPEEFALILTKNIHNVRSTSLRKARPASTPTPQDRNAAGRTKPNAIGRFNFNREIDDYKPLTMTDNGCHYPLHSGKWVHKTKKEDGWFTKR